MFLAMNLRPARWTTVKWPVLNEWQPYNTELSMKFKSPAVGIRVFALFFAESSQSKNRKSKARRSHPSSRATGGMMGFAGVGATNFSRNPEGDETSPSPQLAA